MRFRSPAWDLGAAEIVRPRTRDFVDTCQLAEVIATRTRLLGRLRISKKPN